MNLDYSESPRFWIFTAFRYGQMVTTAWGTTRGRLVGFVLIWLFCTVHAASAFYNPSAGRWLNRDPIGEIGGINLYKYCLNSPVNHSDSLGLIVEDPPKDIGFTYADVSRAVALADKCGIKGPDGKSMAEMFQEMLKSDKTLIWKVWQGLEKGKQIPSTTHKPDYSKPQDAVIHFPKCKPKSCEADIPGTGNTTFNFEAAILHELMHAYEAMTGTYDPEHGEELATKVGDALQRCLKEKNCKGPDGKKTKGK